MAKYDAFGRRIGEDTLADAGWRTRDHQVPAPALQVADHAPQLPGSPPARFRRRRGRPGIVLIVTLMFFAVTGTGMFVAINAISDAIDESIGEPAAPARPEVVLPERDDLVRGLDPQSFLHPDRLARVLPEFQNAGRPLVVRLAPDRIDVQALNGGQLDALQLDGDGLRRLARSPGAGALPTFRWSEVDPEAPRRLMTAAERRYSLHPNEVNYLLLMSFGGSLKWNAYYRGGSFHLTAAPDGSDLKRVT